MVEELEQGMQKHYCIARLNIITLSSTYLRHLQIWKILLKYKLESIPLQLVLFYVESKGHLPLYAISGGIHQWRKHWKSPFFIMAYDCESNGNTLWKSVELFFVCQLFTKQYSGITDFKNHESNWHVLRVLVS